MRARIAVVLGSIVCVLALLGGVAAGGRPAGPGGGGASPGGPAAPASGSTLSTGDGSWVWQWPLPQGNGLSDVTFTSGGTGWAVGDGGTVLVTADGGSAWAARDPGTRADLRAVDFVSAQDGWVVGDGGVLLRTADGGQTWTSVKLEADDLLDVDFISRTTGWVLGRRASPYGPPDFISVVLRSTDGGATWTEQGTWGSGRYRAVGFADESHGWMVGDNGAILRTRDGGATWKAGTLPLRSDMEALCVVDQYTVWAAGDAIVKTDDGGMTWEAQIDSAAGNSTFSGIAVGPGGDVVAAGRFTPDEEGSHVCAVLAVGAGGSVWTMKYETAYVDGAFTAAAFGAERDVCAVGSSGAVVRSVDGGATWTGREPLGARMLQGVDFVDALHGWAVGMFFTPEAPSSLVLRTADGGAMWKEAIFDPGRWSNALTAVDFVSTQVGYAVGEAGLVLRSADGGAKWRVVHASKDGQAHLYAVDFAGSRRGWAVGQKGLILATADGVRWTKQRSRVLDTLFGVSFPTVTVGYAVGDEGRILKTTDRGATWRRLSSGGRASLTAVDFVDAEHGWAVGTAAGGGDSGPSPVVLVTADGGRTWRPQTLPPGAYPAAVDFLDARTGWIASETGDAVFATTDGGATWTAEDAGVAGGLAAVHALDAGHVWAATLDGGVLRRAR